MITITKPNISIVIAFFNMRREAIRTLYTLTTEYQTNIQEDDYEVIVVDSHSTEPLDSEWVESIQANFKYKYVTSPWPTPCRAMNVGIEIAQSDHVVCIIDGARMLSPGVLEKMIRANELFENAFVQTIAMHIGDKLQNDAILEGYNQQVEDELLATIDWQQSGYQLFNISCLAGSSEKGFFQPLPESNCFCAPKQKLLEINGFDEDFTSIGGGFVNHDTLNRVLEDSQIQPVVLLGEASFHQFHGGVATNVPINERPMKVFLDEYIRLRGKRHQIVKRQPVYIGNIHKYAMRFLAVGADLD